MPHNLNLAFSKVLIELSRFLANPFYLQSPARAGNAEQMRDFFFVLMPRQQRYFVDHLNPESLKELYPPCIAHFCWWYSEPVSHVEDTDHGSMDMTYLGPFLRDIHRLRAAAANVGELYSIGPKQLEGIRAHVHGLDCPEYQCHGRKFQVRRCRASGQKQTARRRRQPLRRMAGVDTGGRESLGLVPRNVASQRRGPATLSQNRQSLRASCDQAIPAIAAGSAPGVMRAARLTIGPPSLRAWFKRSAWWSYLDCERFGWASRFAPPCFRPFTPCGDQAKRRDNAAYSTGRGADFRRVVQALRCAIEDHQLRRKWAAKPSSSTKECLAFGRTPVLPAAMPVGARSAPFKAAVCFVRFTSKRAVAQTLKRLKCVE